MTHYDYPDTAERLQDDLRDAFRQLPERVRSLAAIEGGDSYVPDEDWPVLRDNGAEDAAADVVRWLSETAPDERHLEALAGIVYGGFHTSALLNSNAPDLEGNAPRLWRDAIDALLHRADLDLPAELGGDANAPAPLANYLRRESEVA